MNILDLCTGNSGRSILLEPIPNHRSDGCIRAWSAGSKPAVEEYPYWPRAPLRAQWSVEDPAAASPEDQPEAFALAYRLLLAKAESLLALPFEEMTKDDPQLILNRIGG